MYRVTLPEMGFQAAWRAAARCLASHAIPPEAVDWADATLFSGEPIPEGRGPNAVFVPKSFLDLTRSVLCHKDTQAPSQLYAALMRHQTNRCPLHNPADSLTQSLAKMAKSVRRDLHKMHAFVRFHELPSVSGRRKFGSWFEPDHRIIEAAAPFFAKRFADMDWTIATPTGTARFQAGKLTFHKTIAAPNLPEDATTELWGVYFSNIFNPARIKTSAMRSEMPLKYWKNLPETRLIPEMLNAAEQRVLAMHEAVPKEPPKRAIKILDRRESDIKGT